MFSICVFLLILVMPSVAIPQSKSLNTEALTKFKDLYTNEQYGYSFRIPEGLAGFGPLMPATNHGISVKLSENPNTWVYIGGHYNATSFETLDEDIDLYLDWLRRKENEIEDIKREPVRLRNLTAMKLMVRYKSQDTEEKRIEEMIVAFRPEGKNNKSIICTIHLVTTDERYEKDALIFKKILDSWKTVRIRI